MSTISNLIEGLVIARNAIRQKMMAVGQATKNDKLATLASNLTIPNTLDATATASDILDGKTAYVQNEKITGEYVPLDTSDATAVASNIDSGKTAYVNGSKVTGTSTKVNTSDATAVASNIDSGKTAYVNGSKVTGTSTKVNTSDATAVAGDIKSSKTAYVNGSKITGTLAQSDATAAVGDVKSGKTFYKNFTKYTGTLSQSDATATAANIDSGKTAYVNFTKVTGTSEKIDVSSSTISSAQDIIINKKAYNSSKNLITGVLLPTFNILISKSKNGTYNLKNVLPDYVFQTDSGGYYNYAYLVMDGSNIQNDSVKLIIKDTASSSSYEYEFCTEYNYKVSKIFLGSLYSVNLVVNISSNYQKNLYLVPLGYYGVIYKNL